MKLQFFIFAAVVGIAIATIVMFFLGRLPVWP